MIQRQSINTLEIWTENTSIFFYHLSFSPSLSFGHSGRKIMEISRITFKLTAFNSSHKIRGKIENVRKISFNSSSNPCVNMYSYMSGYVYVNIANELRK